MESSSGSCSSLQPFSRYSFRRYPNHPPISPNPQTAEAESTYSCGTRRDFESLNFPHPVKKTVKRYSFPTMLKVLMLPIFPGNSNPPTGRECYRVESRHTWQSIISVSAWWQTEHYQLSLDSAHLVKVKGMKAWKTHRLNNVDSHPTKQLRIKPNQGRHIESSPAPGEVWWCMLWCCTTAGTRWEHWEGRL